MVSCQSDCSRDMGRSYGKYPNGRECYRCWGVVCELKPKSELIQASFDPGYDGIFLPSRIAERLFSGITGATRDTTDSRRWVRVAHYTANTQTIPCNYIQSLSITIRGSTYNTSPTQLVEERDATSSRCWSQIQTWANGSVPDVAGEVRLGTSFLSGIYPLVLSCEEADE